MKNANKELEDMRREMEMLKAENTANYHNYESLRRAFEEQLIKLQNARVEIKNQAKEIDAKYEEVSILNQKNDDLQSKFQEKEAAVKLLSLANDSILMRFKDKFTDIEQVNKGLIFAMDEYNAKAAESEKMICAYKKEVEFLKGLLLESQKKFCDLELKSQVPKELRRRDEIVDDLLREKFDVEDRLKWKLEQFRHLEEAFNKVKEEARANKKDWDSEKSILLNDVSSLQSSLACEIQVANDLRSQLQMCNQALANEEGLRRLLEIQMNESKEKYENIALEFEETKSSIETLTARRDEEIAIIRNSMSAKNMQFKELDFKNTFLKKENQELLESLKEAQEGQISNVDALNSLKSLRQKFKSLELAHKECSSKLNGKKTFWDQQIKKLSKELDECMMQLNSKDNEINTIKEELECTKCLGVQTKIENDEIFAINLILKSKLTEICFDPSGFNLVSERPNERIEKSVTFLEDQFENKNKWSMLMKHINGICSSIQKELASSKSVEASVNSMLAQKLAEFSKLNDGLEQLKAGHIFDKQELKVSVPLLAELESDEKHSFMLGSSAQKLQDQLSTGKSHLENDLRRPHNNQENLEEEIKIETKEATFYETKKKLSQNRELLIEQIMEFEDLIGMVSSKSKFVNEAWDMIQQKTKKCAEMPISNEHHDAFSCKMANGKKHASLLMDNTGQIIERRLPLKEQN